MPSQNPQNSPKAKKTNPQLKSSIVHKPFASGTVNIFNPHRRRTDSRPSPSELFLNARLEETTSQSTSKSPLADTQAQENWLDALLNPWSISAIAAVFLANLISGAVIWRSSRLTVEPDKSEPIPSGSANLAAEEFLPLKLNTLSLLDTAEDTVEVPAITPIPPALAPLNSTVTAALDPEYYYILVEYAGDRSLALARQQVENISLVNFPEGVFIYLGAFKERERAEEFIAQLQRANLTARIYPFDRF